MTERVGRIIRSLLTFSRRTNAADRDRRPSLLRPLIEGSLEIMRHKLRSSDIKIVLDFTDPDLSPTLNAAQIEQILLNLINNADYALQRRNDHKVITIKTTHCFVRDRTWAAVSVSDNGQGIPKDLLGRIFDPFFTTKPQGDGTGLGLAICYGIAQEHAGRLEVTSDVGVGTTLTLFLPLLEAWQTQAASKI